MGLMPKQVADLNLLKSETHKLESHYIDNLVGELMITCCIKVTVNLIFILGLFSVKAVP